MPCDVTSSRSASVHDIRSGPRSSCCFCALQKNFGRPVEWALVKDHAWSTPQLRKLDNPVRATLIDILTAVSHYRPVAGHILCVIQVDVDGKPWPLDAAGKPVLKT